MFRRETTSSRKWQSQHGNPRLAITMLTSSSKLACCVHRVLLTTMSWIKTPLSENPTRPLKHNPQPKAASLGQQALRGPCYLMHRISCLLFSNTRPLPWSSGHTHIFSVFLTSTPTSLPRGSLSQAPPALPPNPLLLAQRHLLLPPAEALLSENRRGIFPSPYKPSPPPCVYHSLKRMLHLRLLLDTCLSESG